MKSRKKENRKLKIGATAPDGTIYAGLSPETGTPLYVLPEDAPRQMDWNQAMEYANNLNAGSHKDWRLPTKKELSHLFNHRAAIGSFNTSGNYATSYYWSSTENTPTSAHIVKFDDGHNTNNGKTNELSVRCVRG